MVGVALLIKEDLSLPKVIGKLLKAPTLTLYLIFFFFSSRRRHTRFKCDWSSDVLLFRSLLDRLSPNPKPCFYAGLEGAATGPFDVVLDAQRDEQFLLGQVHKASGNTYYDVWTSHRVPDFPILPVAFRALHYSIETTISPNNSLDATAGLRLRAETGTERVLAFHLSRALSIASVTVDSGESLPFFQTDGMSLQERSTISHD